MWSVFELRKYYGLIHTTQGKCRKDSSNKYDCVYKLALSKSVCAVSKHKQNILFSKISWSKQSKVFLHIGRKQAIVIDFAISHIMIQ